jgi:hypothetical protein
MPIYTVGKRFSDAIHMEQGCRYQYSGRAHHLILSVANPTADEVYSFKRGPVELRVLGNDIAAFVLFRNGRQGTGFPWCDAWCEWRCIPPHDRQLPEESDDLQWTLFLIDTPTQLVRAIRAFMPDRDFQQQMHRAMRAQALREVPPSHDEADAYIKKMESYTSAELAQMAKGLPFDPTLGTHTFRFVMNSMKPPRKN